MVLALILDVVLCALVVAPLARAIRTSSPDAGAVDHRPFDVGFKGTRIGEKPLHLGALDAEDDRVRDEGLSRLVSSPCSGYCMRTVPCERSQPERPEQLEGDHV
jgi:hypothetical protein